MPAAANDNEQPNDQSHIVRCYKINNHRFVFPCTTDVKIITISS